MGDFFRTRNNLSKYEDLGLNYFYPILRINKKTNILSYSEIMLEVISSERGNQWPLSCYAPIRDRPVVPALYDTSPEELRLSFYQAKKEGRVQDYLNRTNQLYTNAQEVRNFLKQPSAELGQLIVSRF